jgi:hypothetical protein
MNSRNLNLALLLIVQISQYGMGNCILQSGKYIIYEKDRTQRSGNTKHPCQRSTGQNRAANARRGKQGN